MSPEVIARGNRAFAVVQPDDVPWPNGPDDYGMATIAPDKPVSALSVIDPRDWEGQSVPERKWIVRDMIPAETVSLLTGDGAAGKTTLALQLAAARALGRDWIGTVPSAGRTLFLSAEDSRDELHRRLDSIRQHYHASFADFEDLRLIDLVGEDAVLGALQQRDRISATPLFDAVMACVTSFKPDLIIIDALADAYAGDENNRSQARQFIGLLKRPARELGTAFLCLAHPSLNGLNSGSGMSGSTAWRNSVRSQMYFETAKATDGAEPDPDLRTLSVKKTNYGPIGQSLRLRWTAGAYVPEGGVSCLDKMAIAAAAEDKFLELLRSFNRSNRPVSDSVCAAKKYAPKVFAADPRAEGLGWRNFEAAMNALFAKGSITIEEFGPPSKRTRYLVAK